ncbi:reverse transcriptase domain-containing protein, partial [Tanacetum coccineum]
MLKALPTNDARVVVKLLKQLFSRFGTPRAIISDRGLVFACRIPYDLEDLRAYFQFSNQAVSDHIPSDESKAHIEVLSVLCGNKLPILDGSLPLS